MGKLSLNTIKDCLFNEEVRRKMEVDINQVLVTKRRGQSKSRGLEGKGKGNNGSQSIGGATC